MLETHKPWLLGLGAKDFSQRKYTKHAKVQMFLWIQQLQRKEGITFCSLLIPSEVSVLLSIETEWKTERGKEAWEKNLRWWLEQNSFLAQIGFFQTKVLLKLWKKKMLLTNKSELECSKAYVPDPWVNWSENELGGTWILEQTTSTQASYFLQPFLVELAYAAHCDSLLNLSHLLSYVSLLWSAGMAFSCLSLPISSVCPSPCSLRILVPAMHETPGWILW